MDYKNFYKMYGNYNFMLLKAVHFGVYSENMFKSIQNELEEIICCMLSDADYSEYQTLLKEIYELVIRGKDISGFLLPVNKLYKEQAFRKVVKKLPVYAASFIICIFAGIILK